MKSKLDTITLLEMLSKKPKEEIKVALIHLMSNGKIDFVDLATSYTQLQQTLIQINKDKLCEASACIIGHFLDNDEQNKEVFKQRSLFYLNEIDCSFNMSEVNKKFNYNKALGKKASYFAKFYKDKK